MTPHLRRIALLGALFMAFTIQAQRIAFVNTKYILDQMPDYQSAQQELDRFSTQWQKEIDDRWSQVKRLRDAFNAEAILLTEDMKRTRAEDIEKKEREARELQKKRFGVEGDLFKKRQELVQPIQDRIYEAVKEVAGTSYVAIFDIGGMGNNVLYASDKYDKSDSVLRKLGIKPGTSKNSGNLNEEEPSETPDDTKDGGQQDQPKDGGRDGGSAPPPDKPKQ
ncbi:MAG: OmpH family outer membrane protein [Flavobacteriales bacterium]|nr:OmpH family outer membrane protein [Flavobacteriales bacterium]